MTHTLIVIRQLDWRVHKQSSHQVTIYLILRRLFNVMLNLFQHLILFPEILTQAPKDNLQKHHLAIQTQKTTQILRAFFMQESNHSYTNNNQQLDYIKCTPDNFDSSQPADLIYALHGLGGTAETFTEASQICPESASSNSIVIIPSAIDKVWRDESIELLKGLNQQISEDNNIQNIHVVGHSMGGQTALKLFCDNEFDAANIFAVSTSYEYEDCNPNKNPNIYLYHYRGDAIVPIGGGQSGIPAVGEVVSQEELTTNAAINNDCDLSSKQTTWEGLKKTTSYSDCGDNTEVQHNQNRSSNLRPHSWQEGQTRAILDIIENYSPTTISPSSIAPSSSLFEPPLSPNPTQAPSLTPQASAAHSVRPDMAFISTLALGATLAFGMGSLFSSGSGKHSEKIEQERSESKPSVRGA